MDNAGVPQSMRILTIDEFLHSLLHQNNSMIGVVEEVFQTFCDHIVRIYRKDSSLHAVLAEGPRVHKLPIVDKPLQVVIEVNGCHESFTSALFAYHYATAHKDPNIFDMRIWGERYIEDGFGYYFSGALLNRKKLIMGSKYRPDRFDRDLMMQLGLDVRD